MSVLVCETAVLRTLRSDWSLQQSGGGLAGKMDSDMGVMGCLAAFLHVQRAINRLPIHGSAPPEPLSIDLPY